MELLLRPRTILSKLLSIALILLAANVAAIWIKLSYVLPHIEDSQALYGYNYISFLSDLFNFNEEQNIPTFFSALLLLFCAALLFLIGKSEMDKHRKHWPWYGLSLIFLFLSIDEMASIHELLIPTTRANLNVSGLLFFAWVIPYGIAVLLLLILYSKFLFHLPRKTAKLFILSGVVYVFGALIVEMPEGLVAERYGYTNLLFFALVTFEEFLEILGLIIFLYALTSYKPFALMVGKTA